MHFLLMYELSADYLERRAAFRDRHLSAAWASAERGELLLGGALEAPVDRAMLLLIWNRLMGMARRFTNIATRVRTGTLVVPVRQASAPVEDALVLQAPLLTQTPVPL